MKHQQQISAEDFERLAGTLTMERMVRHKIVVNADSLYTQIEQLNRYLAEGCADIYYVAPPPHLAVEAKTAYYFASDKDFQCIMHIIQGEQHG